MEEKKDKVTIKIPKPLYARLQAVITDTGFNSVTDFIVYILRDIASSHGGAEGKDLTQDEIRLIRERLKSLGYL
jgi:Arc/MetJ-type ribon-helix-helix transcriptional regulator